LQRASAHGSWGFEGLQDPVTAAVVGGTALVGGVLSSSAAKSAASTQARAARYAADSQLQQFNTINEQQAPYRNAGYSALNQLLIGFGNTPNAPEKSFENFDPEAYLAANPDAANPAVWSGHGDRAESAWAHYLNANAIGDKRAFTGIASYNDALAQVQNAKNDPAYGFFSHQFDANDLNNNLAPNYEFMLNQGLGQARNQYNSTGGLISGNALQGLNTFAQNYAQNAYQQAYNNYTNNQTNIFNRLASIAGLGQTANNATAQYGTAATTAANNYLTSGAAAQAAGTVGQANAIGNSLSNIGDAYMMYKLFGKTA
jgi:hypothetical protein